MKRTVEQRVAEFKKNLTSNRTGFTNDEFEQIASMFGTAEKFCDVYKIVTTSFYLGFMKAESKMKGGVLA